MSVDKDLYTNNQSRGENSAGSAPVIAAIVVVILLIVGAVIYVAWPYLSNYWSNNEANSTATNTNPDSYQMPLGVTLDTPPANTDPTANWKTLVVPASSMLATTSSTPNTLFGLKYPDGWQVSQTGNSLTISNPSATGTMFLVNWQTSPKPLATYLTDLDQLSKKAWEGKPAVAVMTSTVFTAGAGIPAVLRQQKLLAADLGEIVAYIKVSSTIYTIGLVSPTIDQNMAALFQLLLNNFQIAK